MKRSLLLVLTILLSIAMLPWRSADMHRDDCQPDIGALCERIERGTRLVKEARVQAGSTELYSSLKRNLKAVLERIREELCDNPAAQAKVDELMKKLNALRFVPGQSNLPNNHILVQLEDGLKELAASKCDKATEGPESRPLDD